MEVFEKNIKKFFLSDSFFYIVILTLSVGIFKVLNTHNIPNNEFSIKTTLSVLNHNPDWIAFQNRLLAPYLVLFISKIGFSIEESWKLFLAFFILLQNLTMIYILKKEKIQNIQIIVILSMFSLLFLMMQHYCFYPWDSIDLFFFTLFSYWILKGKHVSYFFILFFISILNRETSLFIPLYLILSSIVMKNKIPYLTIKSFKRFLYGFLTMIFGLIYVKFIRYTLFIPNENTHLDNFDLIGNRIHFFENIQFIFYENFFGTNFIFSLFIIFSVIFFYVFRLKNNPNYLNCYLIFLLITLNIIFFGYFNETRMLLILLPFIFFMGLKIKQKL